MAAVLAVVLSAGRGDGVAVPLRPRGEGGERLAELAGDGGEAAVSQLIRLLAAELAPGVRVNGIAPGVVETDALKAVLTDELRARIVAATPLHRLATAADVASTARWLASPAASYVTGKVIEIDGGAEAPVHSEHGSGDKAVLHQEQVRRGDLVRFADRLGARCPSSVPLTYQIRPR